MPQWLFHDFSKIEMKIKKSYIARNEKTRGRGVSKFSPVLLETTCRECHSRKRYRRKSMIFTKAGHVASVTIVHESFILHEIIATSTEVSRWRMRPPAVMCFFSGRGFEDRQRIEEASLRRVQKGWIRSKIGDSRTKVSFRTSKQVRGSFFLAGSSLLSPEDNVHNNARRLLTWIRKIFFQSKFTDENNERWFIWGKTD